MEMCEDYGISYEKLFYKAGNQKYQDIINYRKNVWLNMNPLAGLNGKPVVYTRTKEIGDLIYDIYSDLEKTSVEENTKAEIYEGFHSSVIEGAVTTIADTINIREHKKKISNKSEQMVFNNINALNKYWDGTMPITEDNVIDIWHIITDGVLENADLKGEKYRSGQVNISMHEPPKSGKIQEYMDKFYRFIETDDSEILIKSAIAQWYFVYVHPFCDGNGRTSRFIGGEILKACKNTERLKYVSVSEIINGTKNEYYKAIELSENQYNDATYFVIYYLKALKLGIERVNYLINRESKLNERQSDLLEKIVSNISRKNYAKKYDVSITTAANELDELVNMGELTMFTDGGECIYRRKKASN